MNSKKILFFAGGSYIYGLEIITLQLINELKQQGFDIRCVINGWNDGAFKEAVEKMGIKVYEVKIGWIFSKRPRWIINTLFYWMGGITRVKKILTEFAPDICHFTDFSNPIMLYHLLKGRKCVYGLHEDYFPSRKILFFFRLLDKRMQIFTGTSGYICGTLRRLKIGDDKIRLIYNGVPSAREQTYENRTPVVIAIVGQVGKWKGHDTLIEAVRLLKSSGCTHFTLHIIGNDGNEYAHELKQKIKDKGLESFVTWRGFIKDQQVLYAGVDVVTVPSEVQEAFSLTIAETMMRGKGVVASEIGAIPELIDKEYNGLTFPAGDATQLAACLRRLLNDPVLLVKLGKAAREKALKEFTLERMTEQHIKIYEELI